MWQFGFGSIWFGLWVVQGVLIALMLLQHGWTSRRTLTRVGGDGWLFGHRTNLIVFSVIFGLIGYLPLFSVVPFWFLSLAPRVRRLERREAELVAEATASRPAPAMLPTGEAADLVAAAHAEGLAPGAIAWQLAQQGVVAPDGVQFRALDVEALIATLAPRAAMAS